MKTRLCIDFPSPQAMAEWFDELRDVAIGGFPQGAAIYQLDGLDDMLSYNHIFIVKRLGNRDESFRATAVIKTEETVVLGGPS